VRVFTPTFRKEIGAEIIQLASALSARLGWVDSQAVQQTG